MVHILHMLTTLLFDYYALVFFYKCKKLQFIHTLLHTYVKQQKKETDTHQHTT